jgi:hypothetical protein
LYLQAIKRDLHQQQGDHDIDLEPLYTLCTALVKYLYNGKIEAAVVQECLEKEKELYNQRVKENSETVVNAEVHPINNGSKPMDGVAIVNDDTTARESPFVYSMHLPNDAACAYNGIFDRLSELRKMDKKKWHHRIVYRVSIILSFFLYTHKKEKDFLNV